MNAKVIAIRRAEQESALSAVCPLCHTVANSISDAALAAGASWKCELCGLRWDAQRLATVAAYAATA
jgi:transposase